MTSDNAISAAFAQLLDSVAVKIADSAARRAKGEISEEEHVNYVLRTIAALSPDTALPIAPGEFVAPISDEGAVPEPTPPAESFDFPQPDDDPLPGVESLDVPNLEESPRAGTDDEPPLLVDQEWEPSEDDLFADLPPYPDADTRESAPEQEPAEQPQTAASGSAMPIPDSGQRSVADETAHGFESSAGTRRPDRAAARGKVIVSGRADWDQHGAVNLEDTMFRLGIDEELADDILKPEREMKAKDREFITDGTKRMLEESRKTKNPGLALVLSLLLPGLGNLYAGSALGIAFLFPAIGCIVLAALGMAKPSTLAVAYAASGILAGIFAASAANSVNSRIQRQQQARPKRSGETTFTLGNGSGRG